MTRHRRLPFREVVGLGVLAGVLAVAPAAHAKIWFNDLSGDTLRWNERVSMTLSGCPGNDSCRTAVEDTGVFLRRGAMRRDPPWADIVAVGRMDGNGRLVFRVPPVRSGTYHLVARIRTDAGPRWLPVSPTFRVRASGGHVAVGCRNRSSASFPTAYTDPGNVVVGPLVLVGAARKSVGTLRTFGGDKLPVLLEPGHRATVEIPIGQRRDASLFFRPGGGILTRLRVSDGTPAVAFVSCSRGARGESHAGSRAVTFWMGFLLARRSQCLPLDIRLDDELRARRVVLRLGVRRCAS